jgi:hypothetical protein
MPRPLPRRAVASLVLAAVGVVAVGVPAAVGAVLAHLELRSIDAGRGDPAGRPTARLARALGAVVTVLWVMGLVGYGLLLAEVPGWW